MKYSNISIFNFSYRIKSYFIWYYFLITKINEIKCKQKKFDLKIKFVCDWMMHHQLYKCFDYPKYSLSNLKIEYQNLNLKIAIK